MKRIICKIFGHKGYIKWGWFHCSRCWGWEMICEKHGFYPDNLICPVCLYD